MVKAATTDAKLVKEESMQNSQTQSAVAEDSSESKPLANKTCCVFGEFPERSEIIYKIEQLGGKVAKSYNKSTTGDQYLYLAKDVIHVPDQALDKKVYHINYIYKLMLTHNATPLDLEDFRLTIDEGLEHRINEASAMVATALAAQKDNKDDKSPNTNSNSNDNAIDNTISSTSKTSLQYNNKQIVLEDGTVYTITGDIFDLNYDILKDLPTPPVVQPVKKQNPINDNGPDVVRKTVSRKFTNEEDNYILQLIRRYPHLRGTHSFYSKIAQIPFFSSHTGNSIRFRFRKILQPRLNFVYDVDPKTNEVRFHPGSDLPIKNHGDSNLLKSQYTAEEDYLLCKTIHEFREGLKNSQSLSASKKKGGVIPESIFKTLTELNPRHSLMSYRDRYRKFASVFGIEKYIQYYDDCIRDGIVPEPMKNLSSRAQRTKRTSYEVDTEETEAILKKALSNVDTNDDENKTSVETQLPVKKYKVSKQKNDVVTDAPEVLATLAEESVKRQQLAAAANSASSPPKEPTNLFEIAEEAQKALGEQIEIEKTQSRIPSALTKVDPVYDASKANVRDIQSFSFNKDTVKKEELSHMISNRFGFNPTWIAYWYDCCNGDATVLKDILIQYLKTRKLELVNNSNYWTKEYDLLLDDVDKNSTKLHSLYSDADITKRINYLETLSSSLSESDAAPSTDAAISGTSPATTSSS